MRASPGRPIRVTRGIQLGLPFALLIALAVGGCTGSQNEARTELERLDEAIQQHAEQYGRFPATLDPERPASPENLPFTPEGDVQLRFQAGTDGGYGATARHEIWICSLASGRDVKCTPVGAGSSEATEDTGARSDSPMDDLLTPAETAAAAAPPVDTAGSAESGGDG